MDELIEEWAAVGLKPMTLPSGYEVRLAIPAPRDLIVRGLLPTQLITEVMKIGGDASAWANVSADNPELAAGLLSGMRSLAADAIRQARKSADLDWRPVSITPEAFSILPPADQAAIIEEIETALGEATVDDTADAKQEAAATVDGFREFRDERRGAAGRKRRTDVRDAAVGDDRPAPADRGAGDRPGARRAPRVR